MKYMIKGTILGDNERSEKIFKGKVKEGFFLTVKDAEIIPLEDTSIDDVIKGIQDDLGDFTPNWVKVYYNYENGIIPYVNLTSFYKSKVVNKTNVPDDALVINNSKGVVLCKNTYHNSICIVENGTEYNPFDNVDINFESEV